MFSGEISRPISEAAPISEPDIAIHFNPSTDAPIFHTARITAAASVTRTRSADSGMAGLIAKGKTRQTSRIMTPEIFRSGFPRRTKITEHTRSSATDSALMAIVESRGRDGRK
jgi:hypothetical protein